MHTIVTLIKRKHATVTSNHVSRYVHKIIVCSTQPVGVDDRGFPVEV